MKVVAVNLYSNYNEHPSQTKFIGHDLDLCVQSCLAEASAASTRLCVLLIVWRVKTIHYLETCRAVDQQTRSVLKACNCFVFSVGRQQQQLQNSFVILGLEIIFTNLDYQRQSVRQQPFLYSCSWISQLHLRALPFTSTKNTREH